MTYKNSWEGMQVKGDYMKKSRLAAAGLAMMMSFGFGITGYAAEEAPVEVKKVVLMDSDEIVYEDAAVYEDGTNALNRAFLNMAPGEERTVAIRVENQNEHVVSFFISGETTQALEEIRESAKGGAYEVNMTVGTDPVSAVTLLDAVAGGYSGEMDASGDGLKDITELEGYQYLAELGQGEYTNLYLTIALDGEGLDSTDEIDYTNAVGKIQFNFRAYYGAEKDPVIITEYKEQKEETTVVTNIIDRVVTQIKEEVVPLADRVKTGDPAVLGIFEAVLFIGIILVTVVVKKRKVEHKS